jgi:serine/threonine protein kinase
MALRGYFPRGENQGDVWGAIMFDNLANGSIHDIMGRYAKDPVTMTWWDDTRRMIVAYGVAVGMMILHENSVVHSNLNTKAIMLDDAREPKISGFPFAATRGSPAKKGSGLVIEFRAPEATQGAPFGLEADVWSYGLLLYALVTNSTSFTSIRERVRNWPTSTDPGARGYKSLAAGCIKEAAARPTFADIVRTFEKEPNAFGQIDLTVFTAYKDKIHTISP